MELKDVLVGAAVQIAAKSASQLGAILLSTQGVPIRDNPWYSEPFGPGIPPVDDFVLNLGLPAGLALYAKVKKGKSKEKAKGLALGAGVAGIATFLHELITRQGNVILVMSGYGASVPPNLVMSKYTVS